MRHGIMLIAFGLATSVPLFAAIPQQAGDATAGAKQFIQCRACHTATKNGPNTVGPNLWGILNAKAAAKAGYTYSPVMKSSALVWNAETLDAFLTKPNGKVPGNKMAFAGMSNAKARRDLIAYLSTLKGR